MKMIFVSTFCNRTDAVSISLARAAVIAGFGLVAVMSFSLWAGFALGERNGNESSAGAATAEVRELLEAERRVIADAKAEQRAHMDALALKVAEPSSYKNQKQI